MSDDLPQLSRRKFVAIVASSAFVVGFQVRRAAGEEPMDKATFAPNAFIRIDDSGVVTLIIPQVEMGQGTYTSLAMILAEELDADWNLIRVEHAPANEKVYFNPLLSIQATGNSNSIRGFWRPLREAGATTRACMVEAAARKWNVAASECRTHESRVIHARTGRSVPYAALVGAASSIAPPRNTALKSVSEFQLIGRPLQRLDTPQKTNGLAKYGIDALPPGVKFATLAMSPVLGGTIARVNDAHAKAIAGVRQVIVLDNIVAVIGDHMWAAQRGLEALDITWNDGPNGVVSSQTIWARLREASKRDGSIAKDAGDVSSVLAEGLDVVTAEYELPLLAHACMEPLNCTVHITPSSAEAWIGTQVMQRVSVAVAKAANLSEAQVTIHNHLLGGGFGRRLEPDMAYDAARIAKHVDGPVKIVWSREEDMRHDYYRPAYHNVLSARLSAGRIVGWKHKISGASIIARFLPDFFRNGLDPDGLESAQDIPYDIPNLRVEFNREEPPGINTGFWRGVGPNNAVFAIESFMDELARKAGKDPIAFRLAHLDRSSRLRAVLDLVRRKSHWDRPLPARCGRGVCLQGSFDSCIATIVECEVDEVGEVDLRQVTTAVDTGIAINPDTIVAQMEGGLIFGLSAALSGEITLENGRVQQSNFHDYQVLRINQVPPIGVHLIKSSEAPGGIGEAGTTAVTPALRNAIYAATGVALRRMPIDRSLLAMASRA
jgi:isoquinoline 1-oxidoreductase beta subunit